MGGDPGGTYRQSYRTGSRGNKCACMGSRFISFLISNLATSFLLPSTSSRIHRCRLFVPKTRGDDSATPLVSTSRLGSENICCSGKEAIKFNGSPMPQLRPVNARLISPLVCCRDRLCARGPGLTTVGSFSFFCFVFADTLNDICRHRAGLEASRGHQQSDRELKMLCDVLCNGVRGQEEQRERTLRFAAKSLDAHSRATAPPSFAGYWRMPSGGH